MLHHSRRTPHASAIRRHPQSGKFKISLLAALLGMSWSAAPDAATAQGATDSQPSLAVRSLVEDAGRMSWSRQGDRLAFDAPDRDRGDGLFDIFVLDAPLSGGADRRGRCLTCTLPDLRGQHSINPMFHPSGETVVFQTIGLARKTKIGAVALNTPQRANRSELWLARTDGKDLWKLTDYASIGGAALDPAFSNEGHAVLWAERVRSRKGAYGAWRLRSAEIKRRRGTPKLVNYRTVFTPSSPALIIPQGFTLDDGGALISANLQPDHRIDGVDLYIVRDRKVTQLTRTGGLAEENAAFHPDGQSITFTSNRTLRRATTADGQGVREIWTMNTDGSEQKRLSFFNEPPADEYRGATFVGDLEWHPDGDWLAAQLVSGRNATHELVLIQWQSSP